VVLIGGEAGIGKSRLTAALLERVTSEPHTRLRYFCSPHHQDIALYPNIAHLERAARFGRRDTDEQRLSKLEAVLGGVRERFQGEGRNNSIAGVRCAAARRSAEVGYTEAQFNSTVVHFVGLRARYLTHRVYQIIEIAWGFSPSEGLSRRRRS
jgi:hypothetical protein